MDFSKKTLPVRLLALLAGLALYGAGVSLTIRANIGYSPWDIFHQGIANHTGISIGMVSILVGLVIVLINSLFKEKIGFATIANAVLVGTFIDLFNGIFPKSSTYAGGVIMMLAGLAVIGIATAIYLSVGLGAGPRDGVMLTLTRMTGKDVAWIRNGIELAVTLLGYLLGGPVGLGTLLTALTMGFFVKLAFRIMHFDMNGIRHQYLNQIFSNKLFKPAGSVRPERK